MKGTILILLVVFSGPAHSNIDSTNFDIGMARYIRLQYVNANQYFTKASKENSAEAFTMLALMHFRGDGMPQDFDMAVKLANEAVNRGDKKAMYVLGMVGLEPDKPYSLATDTYFVEAIPAMHESANRGNIFWTTRLAYCYRNGRGVNQDIQKAVTLYQKGVAANYAMAIHNYAILFLDGEGVPMDYEKALALFRRSAALGLNNVERGYGSESGICDVATAYLNGTNNLPRDLTKAMGLYLECTQYNYGPAYTGIGRLLNQNFPKAKEYLEKGIAAGDGEAASELALHYLDTDTVKCRKYYELALRMNDNSGYPEAGLSHLYKSNKPRAQHYTFQALAKGAPPEYVNMPELLIGEMAPDFELLNEQDKPVRLSSLRGRYVLIDFWASWCGPCRMENPNVVKAYQHYKGNGFTVLGVSLDEDRNRWLGAIKKDNLCWTQLSDLKGWNSAAGKLYSVSAIPQNFLLDKEGRMIATDLRGEQLWQKLQVLAW